MPTFVSTGKILALLISYRYAVFFPMTVAEGPIVTIIAGFLVTLGYVDFWLIYVLAVVGDVVGDILYYALGRWGSKRIFRRGSFLGIKAEQLKKVEIHFDVHAGKTLLFGKWTHSVGAIILTAAGMAKMPLNKFVFYNTIGTIPKALALMLIGYYFGRAYQEIDKYFGYASLAMLLLIVVAVAIYISTKRFRKRINIDGV
ncbi:MAG: DedA family protein [bacterium]